MQQYKAAAYLDLHWNMNHTSQKGPPIHYRILDFKAQFSMHTHGLTTQV